jgi:hypothetical protein
LGADIRSIPFRGYVILIRYCGTDQLDIINIVEGHRDVAQAVGRDR